MSAKYYTTFQVSKLLGVSLATVVNWTKAGMLAAHRTPGGHRRIAESDLVEFARTYKMPLEIEPPAPSGPARVLIVDDDEDHLAFVVRVLEPDFDVETATSGFAAGLAVARFRPDCIVLDIRMPGMDGFDVVDMLRGKPTGRSVPVIACTAYLDDETRARVTDRFDGLLAKPFGPPELLEVVRAGLGRSPRTRDA